MTKNEVLEALDKSGVDYEVTAEHDGSFHIIVKADENEEVEA